MKFGKRLVCLLLCLCMMAVLPMSAAAQEDVTPYVQRMIQYYLHYQDAAEGEIEALLEYITSVDPGQGALWRAIMDDWRWVNEDMQVHRDVLPDGLPQDDSLCIVILGFGLRADGSMKEELIDRLVVGLASALKYPNAWVCVTGGPTAKNTKDTEAGQMAAWLEAKGLAPERIIREKKSLSTTANARNVTKILRAQYPQVRNVAVVSSDYHIPWGVSMFTTASHYAEYNGEYPIAVVGNASNATSNNTNTFHYQAKGISGLTNIPFDGESVPALYATETTVETLPPAEPQVEVEEKDNRWMLFPAVMIALAVLVLLIPTKKRSRKK